MSNTEHTAAALADIDESITIIEAHLVGAMAIPNRTRYVRGLELAASGRLEGARSARQKVVDGYHDPLAMAAAVATWTDFEGITERDTEIILRAAGDDDE